MSRENPMQLLTYPDRGQSFLPAIPAARVEVLEDRLFNQEKTTSMLLEQAFKIKEDVSSLRGNRGSQWDAMAQRLLENHMQTITQIVKQLSKDIEALESQIHTRDNVSTGTSFAVQSLDKKQLHGIGDLRGRVARCDASIAKLSGDLAVTKHELRAQEKEVQSITAALEAHMKEIDVKVMQLLGRMETSISEQSSKVKSAQGKQHHEFQLLEIKIGGLVKDIEDQILNQRRWTESQLQRSDQEQAQHIEKLLNSVREKMDATDNRFQENLHHLTEKLDNKGQIHKLESKLNRLKHAEDKMSARMSKMEAEIWDELQNIKSEYRAGFQAIQESLNSLQQIQETKVKLESKKVQKDIKQIRRKIVELKDV
ncbi:protein FAM81B [Spea bombifrons]|uniref:protein FAM81B n=1 Tax=Spea bombifrons TaxID=233779 RepID=UPI00234AB9F0|nr:protein FAM81B [Spea bombifrons]